MSDAVDFAATRIVQLADLLGTHTLTAIGRVADPADRLTGYFTLDGFTYCVTEDPDDGYRSAMRDIVIVDPAESDMVPIDPPLVVEVRSTHGQREDSPCTSDDVHWIYFVNERTGLVVLEVGTDHSDSYYPSFIWSWTPEGYTPRWLEARSDAD
jgi:hypothetical protein